MFMLKLIMPDQIPSSCLSIVGGGQLNKIIPIHVLYCNSSALLSHYIDDYMQSLFYYLQQLASYGFDVKQ